MKIYYGNIVDIVNERIFSGKIFVENEKIVSLEEEANKKYSNYILPGFIDSHIHIESSMLSVNEFARTVVKFGTIATVSDPHEITNVLGIEGINYMLKSALKVPLKIYFSIPSCVPATIYDKNTNFKTLTLAESEKLMKNKDLLYLGEFMDIDAVLKDSPNALKKITLAKKYHKLIDGHAPELMGEALKKYVSAGISTDHESISQEEAIQKINLGMFVQIREGSSAKNFAALVDLLNDYSDKCMFCSDDKNPYDLLNGHINLLVKRAIAKGIDIFKVLKTATLNPIKHYNLQVGLLQKGDFADFIIVDNLKNFEILKTIINGKVVFEKEQELLKYKKSEELNNFAIKKISPLQIKVKPKKETKINVIKIIPSQLITEKIIVKPKIENGFVVSNTKEDILKIVVLNRYRKRPPVIGFIKGFSLQEGAIASSVSHDSHNLISIGTDDDSICKAINLVIKNKGGICYYHTFENHKILPLPIAGLMSNLPSKKVLEKYLEIDSYVKKILKCKLESPFMSMAFLSLIVIPELKINAKGLFDSEKLDYIKLFEK